DVRVSRAPTAGGPIIEAVTGGVPPGIIFKGPPEQFEEAKKWVRALDPTAPIAGPGTGIGVPPIPGNKLTITFNEGNAGILAEAIAEAMKKMGKNPVEVRNLTGTPGGAPPPPPKTPAVNP